MNPGQKLVCIRDSNQNPTIPCVKKGEIYTLDSHAATIGDLEYIYLEEFVGDEYGRAAFRSDYFRPVDNTFGENIADILEKQLELEEVEAYA